MTNIFDKMPKFLPQCTLLGCFLILTLLACQPSSLKDAESATKHFLITSTLYSTVNPISPTRTISPFSTPFSPNSTFTLPLVTVIPTTLPLVPLPLTTVITPPLSSGCLLAFLGVNDYVDGYTPSQYDLYLIGVDNQPLNLTNGSVVKDFVWSPDGKKLLFSAIMSPGSSTSFDLYFIDVTIDTLSPVLISHELEVNAIEGEATWSPDSKNIAFTQYLGGEEQIYIMNEDGTQTRFLTEGGSPSWSPDGTHIVFVRRLSKQPAGDIYVVNKDGDDLRQITTNFLANRPVFSPNGDLIAFVSNQVGHNFGIYIVKLDGSGMTKLMSSLVFPNWLSENQILFAVQNSIFSIDVADGQRTKIVQLPANFFLQFASPQPTSCP